MFDMPDGDPTSRTFQAGPLRVRVTTGRPGAAEPRERLSADRIVDVALAQMKERGYDAVSMRSIARQLGTGAASLYAHVANRDELDILVLERVASRIEVPEPDPERWREQLRAVMVQMLALYDEHPGVARASLGLIPMSPRLLRSADRMAAIMRAGGISDQAVAWFLDLMGLYVGSVAVERDVWRTRSIMSEDHDEHHEAVHQFFRDLPEDEFPVLASIAEAMSVGDQDDRFGFGLDILIAGLAAYGTKR